MEKYKNILIWIAVISLYLFFPRTASALIAIAVGGFIIVIGALAIMLIASLFRDGRETRKLNQFKKKSEGKYFLWYSSNKRLRTVITRDLKPLLDWDTEIIYNNQESVETRLSELEWRYLLAQTNTIKFPKLITIRNGQVKAISFHKEVHARRFLEMEKEDCRRNVLIKLEKFKNE